MKIRPEKNSGPYDTSQRSTNCPTSRLREFICNQHNNKLSVGLVAQRCTAALRCTGNVKVMDSNPVRVWIFFRPNFHFYFSSVRNCENRFHIRFFICFFCIFLRFLSSFLRSFATFFPLSYFKCSCVSILIRYLNHFLIRGIECGSYMHT